MTQNLDNRETVELKENFCDMCDNDLIAAINLGDRLAYKTLVERYLNKIWRLGMSILYDEQEAEEATQEVFLSLWQTLKNWDPDGPAKFSTWLYRVSFNKCIDLKRSRKPTQSEDHAQYAESEDPNGYQHVLQAQLSDKVTTLLENLPERQRMAIMLFYYEELSVSEISANMKTTEQSVRSLLKRGRRILKEKIQYDPAFQSWDFSGYSGNVWR